MGSVDVPPGWLTAEQAAQRLSIKSRAVRMAIDAHKLPSGRQVGPRKAWIVEEADVERYRLARFGTPPPPAAKLLPSRSADGMTAALERELDGAEARAGEAVIAELRAVNEAQRLQGALDLAMAERDDARLDVERLRAENERLRSSIAALIGAQLPSP